MKKIIFINIQLENEATLTCYVLDFLMKKIVLKKIKLPSRDIDTKQSHLQSASLHSRQPTIFSKVGTKNPS